MLAHRRGRQRGAHTTSTYRGQRNPSMLLLVHRAASACKVFLALESEEEAVAQRLQDATLNVCVLNKAALTTWISSCPSTVVEMMRVGIWGASRVQQHCACRYLIHGRFRGRSDSMSSRKQ